MAIMTTTVDDSRLIAISDGEHGNVNIATCGDKLPFVAKSIFCIYGVPEGMKRGEHAHEKLCEFVIAAKGAVTITLFDGHRKVSHRLDNPGIGLFIPAGLWLELEDFSEDAVCVVLASEKYEETDYVRLLEDFINRRTK
jgi:dTDP-4-dehydrorhamnose 3,5-epimerase-like enzyme